MQAFNQLVYSIRACTVCAGHLPYAPRPVVRLHPGARILIVGQAPGTKVHETGIPWNDPSGDKLRQWLGLSPEIFYNEQKIAIMPMGFCYPGRGSSGDKPPRPECAPLWHVKIRSLLPNLQLVLLVGSYATRYYLPERAKLSVRELVLQADFACAVFLPLVHPSPRNKLWLKQNPWFEQDITPRLRKRIQALL